MDSSAVPAETNRVALLFADGRQEELPLMYKSEVAARVMAEVEVLLEVN